MKKIFALTVENDFHSQRVSKILKEKYGIILIELEREQYAKKWCVSLVSNGFEPQVIISIDGVDYYKEQIGAIWLRRNFLLELDKDETSPTEDYISAQTAIHVNGCMRLLAEEVYFINSPEANWKANSKGVQAYYAYKAGLLIPPSFQGGSPTILDSFMNQEFTENQLCIKPIDASHLKIDNKVTLAHYTKLFKRRSIDELESVIDCPVMIQEFIPKDYEIRATVVEAKIFATSIDTKKASDDAKIDWRHYDWANTPYHAIELPEDIKFKLLMVMKSMSLSYGAFDLIKNFKDEYYFLEVNAQGQWLWIEDLTGLKISEAIADVLKDKACQQ